MDNLFNYLIGILFSSQGSEKVIKDVTDVQKVLSSTKNIYSVNPEGQKTLTQIQDTFKVLNPNIGKSRGLMDEFGLAMRRALIVAPVWMLMREVTNALLEPMKQYITMLFELDAGLAKISTVVQGADADFGKFNSMHSSAAIRTFTTTSASMKNITEAMFQLGKTGFDTSGIINNFNSILNLSIGTFSDVSTAGKLAIETYELFGASLTNH